MIAPPTWGSVNQTPTFLENVKNNQNENRLTNRLQLLGGMIVVLSLC